MFLDIKWFFFYYFHDSIFYTSRYWLFAYNGSISTLFFALQAQLPHKCMQSVSANWRQWWIQRLVFICPFSRINLIEKQLFWGKEVILWAYCALLWSLYGLFCSVYISYTTQFFGINMVTISGGKKHSLEWDIWGTIGALENWMLISCGTVPVLFLVRASCENKFLFPGRPLLSFISNAVAWAGPIGHVGPISFWVIFGYVFAVFQVVLC